MRIFLVRHLEYDNPEQVFPYHLPVTLSLVGRKKAKRIGEWFKKQNCLEIPIYTSPIVRAVQTAEIIASQTNSHVYVDTDLTEVLSSKLQGKPAPTDNDWSQTYEPGMQEDQESILKRILESYYRHQAKGENFILVSHGDNLTLLHNYLAKKESPAELDKSPEYVEKGEFIEIILNNLKITDIFRHRI